MSVPDQTTKKRPITFVFQDMNKPSVRPKQITLYIRPEDLTRTDTSRLTPHHTLGGAFADSFGEGLPTVQLSGHTGWGAGNVPNGQDSFIALYKMIYQQWHFARKEATKDSSKDPDKVKLIFSDQLDSFTWVVAPLSFVLRRSLSNPLVSYYQISLIWVSNDVSSMKSFMSMRSMLSSAIASFESALSKINDFINSVTDDINGFFSEITAPIREVMDASMRINQSVLSTLKAGGSLVNSVTGNITGLASNLSFAVGNILSTVVAVANFPAQAQHQVMQARSAWLNLFCLSSNILNPEKQLPNYDYIYGAAMCSSTAGGRPTLNLPTNTLELVFPLPTGDAVAFNQNAAVAINKTNALDIVQKTSQPMTTAQKGALLQQVQGLATTIASGTVLPKTWKRPVNRHFDLILLEATATTITSGNGLLTASMTLDGLALEATTGSGN